MLKLKSKKDIRIYYTLLQLISLKLKKKSQEQDMVTLSMTPIINISFNKNTMSRELINQRILHTPNSVIKEMFCHKILTGLPKKIPKKINQAPFTICYTANMTIPPKVTTVDTTNLQPVELIHVYFTLYNVTSVRGFTSMITLVCGRTIIIWVFITASKISPVWIIILILTILKNEKNPCRCVRVYEDGTLAKSIDFTNLLVDDLIISIETTGSDAFWLNGNN